MSKVLKQRLPDCPNKYTAEDLYDRFGICEEEVKICLSCKYKCTEGGIISCKYIVNGVMMNTDNGGSVYR